MKAFDNSEFESHKAEVRARWGKTGAYAEYAEKTKDYGKGEWSGLAAGMDAVFAEFALCMKSGAAADGKEAQLLVKKLKDHISENYYNCTAEILRGLGKMYTADERFRKNIDQHAEGTAAYAAAAIEVYCRKC